MRSLSNPSDTTPLRTSVLLICIFICLYTLTLNAVFRVDDEHILAARTQSLALWGELSETQVYGNQRLQALIPLGDPATQIEPGQAILGSVFTKMAFALKLGGAQALFSLNLYLTAISVGLVYSIVRTLGYSNRVGIWCAVLFGSGSMAWPYAMTYFRDTLAMAMSALVFLGWTLVSRTNGRPRLGAFLLIAGGFLVGVLVKNSVVALLPVLGIAMIVECWRVPQDGRNMLWGCGLVLALSLAFLVLLALLVVLPTEGIFARFSLEYYRDLTIHFLGSLKPSLLAASIGPFISPAKSMFLFSPPLLLTLVRLRKNLTSRPFFAFMAVSYALLLALAQGLFYRERWAGSFGWGLRSVLPALPGLFPLLAPTIESVLSRMPPRRELLLWGVLILSVVVQMSGVVVPWHHAFLDWQAQGMDPFAANAAWNLRFLAIPNHILRLARLHEWSLVWNRLLQAGAYGVLLIPALSLVIGAVAIRMVFKPHWRGAVGGRSFVVIVMTAMFLPTALTWRAIYPDPAWGADRLEFQLALNTVRQQVSEQDVVIIDSYGTPLWTFWMNRWDGSARWFSLPFELPSTSQEAEGGSHLNIEVLGRIIEQKEKDSTVWYINTNETPDYSLHMERHWLEQQYGYKNCMVYTAAVLVEVCEFRFDDGIGSLKEPLVALD